MLIFMKYIFADEKIKEEIGKRWDGGTDKKVVAKHLHVDDGFSIVAIENGKYVGLISVSWKDLPYSLEGKNLEGFIDIVETHKDYRRRGIGKSLLEKAAVEAKKQGAFQLRAWSSKDKKAAIAMWKALGFGLHPETEHPGGEKIQGYYVIKIL